MRAKRIAAAVIGLAAWTGAAEPIDEGMTVAEYHGEARGAAAADPGAPDIARLLGVTLLLVGAAGGLYFLCRRLRGGRRVLRGRNVKVLETAYVSPKHTLALVRIRNRILLLQESNPKHSWRHLAQLMLLHQAQGFVQDILHARGQFQHLGRQLAGRCKLLDCFLNALQCDVVGKTGQIIRRAGQQADQQMLCPPEAAAKVDCSLLGNVQHLFCSRVKLAENGHTILLTRPAGHFARAGRQCF